MLINLRAQIHATDHNKDTIKDQAGLIPDLGDTILYALRFPHASDSQTDYVTKAKLYSFIKRIDGRDTVELTKPEIEILKDRVGKIFVQVEVVGQVGELLETPYVEPKAEPIEAPMPFKENPTPIDPKPSEKPN